MSKYDLNVQCFAKRNPEELFAGENNPRLLYVSHVRPSNNPHPRILHSHQHHVEILLICSSASTFLIHNKKQLVKEGDLVIYNAGIVHDDLTSAETEIGYYCVAVGDVQMPGLPANALTEKDDGYVFPAGRHFHALKSLCSLMFESLSREDGDAETFCRSLMHAFLVRSLTVVRENRGISREKVEEEHILGNRIKEYIDSHYHEPLSLQEIGNALNISPYYLSHVFKDMSGYSPIQYLLRRRLGEAQTLLISTELPIIDIALMTGFDTQNYFNAQFTKHVGVSPKRYRDNYVVGKSKSS